MEELHLDETLIGGEALVDLNVVEELDCPVANSPP